MSIVLGINSSFTSNHHDPSAAIIINGMITAAAEEERFNRVKTSIGWFPFRAIMACLETAKINIRDVELVCSPGLASGKDLSCRISKELERYFGYSPQVKLYAHYVCHIAGAFYPSGFDSALGLTIDGAGDGVSLCVAACSRKNGIEIIRTESAKNSLGNLYAAVTEHLGFHRAEGEFKVMGMAALGTPKYDLSSLISRIGTLYNVNDNIYGNPPAKSVFESFYDKQFFLESGLPCRLPAGPIYQEHFDLAASVQTEYLQNLEKILNSLQVYNNENIVFSGGCALNCLANNIITNYFKGIYIMPAASDRGLALGAACLGTVELNHNVETLETMLLGKQYNNDHIKDKLDLFGINYKQCNPYAAAEEEIMRGNVVGWFQGRSEFGPRSLGARSVLAKANEPGIKNEINKRIKFREDYRPFAPAILESSLPKDLNHEYFNYMNIAPKIIDKNLKAVFGEALHLDNTARIQRVTQNSSPHLNELLSSSRSLEKSAVINTSFNLNGEPIVETPRDAIRTFYSSAIDTLIIGDFIIKKQ